MKTIISLFILILPMVGQAQTYTKTLKGYEIESREVWIRVDTITKVVQARIYMRGKHWCNVQNKGYKTFHNDLRMYFDSRITFPYIKGEELIVWNKRHTFKYLIR